MSDQDRDDKGLYQNGHKNAGPGRPSSYKDEYAEQAAKLCKIGATDYELADFFNVDTRTIYRWKHEHPAFCQSIVAAKEMADERVERSFYNRCVCLLYTSPSPRDLSTSRMPSSA